jgi:hypothetical protein
MATDQRSSRQRGAVLPSPVVMLSILAVVLAGVTYVLTRAEEPTEREVTTAAAASESPTDEATEEPAEKEKPKQKKKADPKPRVVRAEVPVVVFNNSGIRGLAATTSSRVDDVGWQVVGADDWYGTIPATTVYFPPRLEAAADQLALDLGVERVRPAVDPMRLDRLTLILTGSLD